MRKNIINTNSGLYLIYDYLTLPIDLNISSKIKIGSETFFAKKGYHVSLLYFDGLSMIIQKKILDFVKKYPVKIKRITKIYRLVGQDDKQSIIVRVRLQGLRNLISSVNKHFGHNFVYPPTHITLFTLENQYGIGINSTSEYNKFTSQISERYSSKLSKSFKLI